MSREEQDEAVEKPVQLSYRLALLFGAAVVCSLLLSPPYLGISERALTQRPEGRVAKSLLQNSLECDVLAQLQGVMKRLLSAQTKRHVSLQPG